MIAPIFLWIRLITKEQQIRIIFSRILAKDYQFPKFIAVIVEKNTEKKKTIIFILINKKNKII